MSIIEGIVLLLRLLNSLMSYVNEEKWRESGRQEVVLDLTNKFNEKMKSVRKVISDNENLTPEERKKILMED